VAAEQARISVRTLCRQVKAVTGLAAGDWLRRIKLHQAGEALRGSRQPVKAICDQLGFGSDASLHRAFKAATGMTPAAYRQVEMSSPP
jgi:AraC-like DNA-binding protein